jgi:hypothetical protein
MAYDEYLGERITRIMQAKGADFFAKNMMGGLIFMVDNKMCVGIHHDKKYQDNLVMARIGLVAYETEIKKEETLPMDFTGRPMGGYIFVTPEGYDSDDDLEYWVQKALDFNPEAKASKSKKQKS